MKPWLLIMSHRSTNQVLLFQTSSFGTLAKTAARSFKLCLVEEEMVKYNCKGHHEGTCVIRQRQARCVKECAFVCLCRSLPRGRPTWMARFLGCLCCTSHDGLGLGVRHWRSLRCVDAMGRWKIRAWVMEIFTLARFSENQFLVVVSTFKSKLDLNLPCKISAVST